MYTQEQQGSYIFDGIKDCSGKAIRYNISHFSLHTLWELFVLHFISNSHCDRHVENYFALYY